jgi:hypothetical protein
MSEPSRLHDAFHPFGIPASVAPPKRIASPSRRQGLGISLLDALHGSRRRQALREIDYCLHLLDEAKAGEVRQAIKEITRERPKIELRFGIGLGSFSSFAARHALSPRHIGFVSSVLAFALIIFFGFAINGGRPLSIVNILGTDLLPMATFGSVLIGSVAAGLAGFAFSAIAGS